MVNTPTKPTIEDLPANAKAPAKETLLTPRFYTTDFDEMGKMDLSVNEDELRALVEELRIDYNQKHFVRDAQFDQAWDHIDGETRELFMEFLERSCTAEFSGFLLYKELGRRLKDKNPLLAECFNLISRDEARHAGFLNKAMSDFGMSLDLGFLTPISLKKLGTGATSPFSVTSKRILKTAFTLFSISLKTGAKMKTVTVTSLMQCCDRSLLS
jgi:magnesium-protoporphyrin IX monomethyl ester (oxidative) cyclase